MPSPSIPDFLFIGAPRAGSTWLYRHLRRHPGIWMPPIKNLLYRHQGAWPNKLRTLRQIKDGLIPVKPSELGFYAKFFLGSPNSACWYKSLFQGGRNATLRGDISDDLFVLTQSQIADYKAINPHLRVFAILRDPIDRIFSHIKHNFVNNRGRDFTTVAPSEYHDLLTSDWALDRSHYHRSLSNWLSVFGPDQVRLYDHAQLHDNPLALLEDICAFIGAPFDPGLFQGAEKRVNASQDVEVPIDAVNALWPLLREDMQALPAIFPPAQDWLRRYEAAGRLPV
jgi:hypothetical protein